MVLSRFRLALVCVGLAGSLARGSEQARIPADLENDPAVRAALEALSAGSRVALKIVAGKDSEAFRITQTEGGYSVESGAALGIAYGVYRLGEEAGPREEAPALRHRMVLMRAPPDVPAFETMLRRVIENGANAVLLWNAENYVPWEGEPLADGPRLRTQLAEFARLAHAYHLRLYLFGTELLLPARALEALGPSPSQDRMAEALRDKYRRLLRAFPELDGIAVMPGEQYPHGPFRGAEVIRHGAALESSYRAFLKAVHGVVAGEFGKTFIDLTWATNDFEQHSSPAVFQRVFTGEVPQGNLLLAIKVTKVDQWYYGTAFNPTFGLTPHPTIAHVETGSSYHGLGTMLDFPARFFQAGMEWAAERGTRGVFYGFPARGLLEEGMFYVIGRLAWDPHASADELAERWARRAFGAGAAPDLARLLNRSGELLRSGWYLRPVSLRGWNPLPLVRVDNFRAAGRPAWDHGAAQERFLYSVYLECKPWLGETRAELERGARLADEAVADYLSFENKITNRAAAEQLRRIVEHTRAALALNRSYAECIFAYFQYREKPDAARHAELGRRAAASRQARSAYRAAFSFFHTSGIDVLLDLAERRLGNNAAAEAYLASAPSEAELLRRFAAARAQGDEWLRAHPEAVRLGVWEGSVDGSDILVLRADRVSIEHLEGDAISAAHYAASQPLPASAGTVVVKALEARGTALVLEQPSAANAYAVRIYVEDPAAGPAVYRLEFWFAPAKR
jgi:hypothetical protein